MSTATAIQPKVKKIRKKEGDPYLFSELSKEAKQKAISDNYDWNVDHDWWEWTYDDAKTCGIDITSFNIGRGRNIEGDLLWRGEAVAEKIMEEHGEGCNTYIDAKSFLDELIVLKVKQRLLEGTTDDEGYEVVEVIDNEIEELEAKFLKDILQCYWKILYDEYEYLTNEEAIRESIEMNSVQFNKDGSRY